MQGFRRVVKTAARRLLDVVADTVIAFLFLGIAWPQLAGHLSMRLLPPAIAAEGDSAPTADKPSAVDTELLNVLGAISAIAGSPGDSELPGTFQIQTELLDAWDLTRSGLVDLKTGETWPMHSLVLDREFPVVDLPTLRRTLQAKISDGTLLLLVGAFSGYVRFFKYTSPAISVDWDGDYLVTRLEDGRRKILDMNLLAEGFFEKQVPSFTIAETKNVGTTEALNAFSRTSSRIIRTHPELFDQTELGQRISLLCRHPEEADELVASAAGSCEVTRAVVRAAEQVRPIPFHPLLESSKPVLDGGEIAEIGLDPQSQEEVVVSITSRQWLAGEIERQAALLHTAELYFVPDGFSALAQLSERLLGQRSRVEAAMSGEGFLNAIFQREVGVALAGLDDAGLKVAAVARQVQWSGERRAKATPQEILQVGQFYADISARIRKVSSEADVAPLDAAQEILRTGRVAAEQRVENADGLGALSKFLAAATSTRVLNVGAALGATVTATAIGAQVAPEQLGKLEQAGLYLLSLVQQKLSQTFPIYQDPAYVSLLWGVSLPLQILPLLTVGAAFYLGSRFSQHKAPVFAMLMGIRAMCSLQRNPLRLLSSLVRQEPVLAALREGEVIRPIPLAGEARAAAILDGEAQIARGREMELMANFATYSMAALETGQCPGSLWSLKRGKDLSSPVGAEAAVLARDEILGRLKQMSGEEWAALIQSHGQKIHAEVQELKHLAAQWVKEGKLQPWHHQLASYAKARAASLAVGASRYSEALTRKMKAAVPEYRSAYAYYRYILIDWMVSMWTASHIGAWADLARQDRLHAQREGIMGTSLIANVDYGTCLINVYTRDALQRYWVYAKKAGQTRNLGHEVNSDFGGSERTRLLSIAREAGGVATTIVNVQETQALRKMYDNMIQLRLRYFQSLVLIGLVSWLVMPAMISAQTAGGGVFSLSAWGAAISTLMSSETWVRALFLSILFMFRQQWGYRWVYDFLASGVEHHEGRIEADYLRYKGLLGGLQQAVRLGLESDAQKYSLELLKHSRENGSLRIPTIPLQAAGESWTEYGEKLVQFFLENPRFPKRANQSVMGFIDGLCGFLTMVPASYMFSQNGEKATQIFGMDWLDWNIFTNIPEADGLLAIVFKSLVITGIVGGAQRLLNWGVHRWKLSRDLSRLEDATGAKPVEEREHTVRAAQARVEASWGELLGFAPVRWAVQLSNGVATTVNKVRAWMGLGQVAADHVLHQARLEAVERGIAELGPWEAKGQGLLQKRESLRAELDETSQRRENVIEAYFQRARKINDCHGAVLATASGG